MEKTNKEKAIKGILYDHIIFERICESILKINNLFEPNFNRGEWIPDYHYRGVSNAYDLLNITDNDDLCELLGALTIGFIKDNPKKSVAELSEKLYLKWLIAIRENVLKVA